MRWTSGLGIFTLIAALSGAGCDDGWDKPPPPDRSTDPDALPDLVHDGDVVADLPVDTAQEPDADADEEMDAEPECVIDFGTFTPTGSRAGWATAEGAWSMQGLYEGAGFVAPYSIVDIESWFSSGGPQDPGTYVVDHFVSFSTCGMCVWVMEGRAGTGGQDAEKLLIATRATVDIDTLDGFVGGSIGGTLSDAYFVEADASGSSIVEGGDGYCLDLWTFSQVFDDPHGWTGSAGSGSGAGTPHLGRGM